MAYVTILADASFCSRTSAAGWGYWIASDRGKLGGGGELKRATSSAVAEMMAVVNALDVGLRGFLIQKDDTVLIQTDCQEAIIAFCQGTSRDVDQTAVLEAYFVRVRAFKLTVRFKHVKGHTSRHTHTDARYGANRACDGRARRAMQQMRKRIDGMRHEV
jgi:ribonuclease HI